MEWVPESFPRAGGLAAAGFYKLLGRPRLDPLTVLVRETAQNSWDARVDDGDPVGFSIQGWHLNDDECAALRREVFARATKVTGTNLAHKLSSPGLIGLYICDRNTKGLGGPLRADEADPDETYDWVDLVLNAGKANTQGHTGGTYGFGKTISYVVSTVNAIVIHSKTVYRGREQTRLIACAIGEEFTSGGRLYTGRHWWGRGDQGSPRPIVGREAARVARVIGMPEFEAGELGTNILIIAPDLGGRTPDQAMTFMAESVTWHLWPKLMKRRGHVAMDVNVSWNGDPVTIPRPEDRPPLHGFAQAFQAILDGGVDQDSPAGLRMERLQCQRPITVVGDLVTVPLVHRERAEVDDGSNTQDNDAPAPAASIRGVCHHVALLRTPELVIEYLEGPAPPEGGTEWAGVFRARDEHDGFFAAAEPPTHDTWNPVLLPKSPGRTIVNVGIREIKAALERRWARKARPTHEDAASTALIADELAPIVRSIESKGSGRRIRDTPPGSPGIPTPKIDVLHSGPIQLDRHLGTIARVRIRPAPTSQGTRLHIRVAAALDGTVADDELDPVLALLEARLPNEVKQLSGTRQVIDLNHGNPLELELVVQRSPDTTVLFYLNGERL